MGKSVLLANQSTGYLMVDIVNAYVQSGKYDRVELFAGEIIFVHRFPTAPYMSSKP